MRELKRSKRETDLKKILDSVVGFMRGLGGAFLQVIRVPHG